MVILPEITDETVKIIPQKLVEGEVKAPPASQSGATAGIRVQLNWAQHPEQGWKQNWTRIQPLRLAEARLAKKTKKNCSSGEKYDGTVR